MAVPTCVGYRPADRLGTVERPADAALTDPAPRCLERPPRLTLRQTLSGEFGRGRVEGGAATANRTLRIAHVNPRSLLPSIDDVIDTVKR